MLIKRFIKIFLFCTVFGSLNTGDMSLRFSFSNMVDITILSFVIFTIVSILKGLSPNNSKIINIGKASVENYIIKKKNVSKYTPIILKYMRSKNISADKALYIELYYLLFNGYLRIDDNKILVNDKSKDNLKEYQLYIIDKIEKKESIIFKDWKKIYINDIIKIGLIKSESNKNVIKGILQMIICAILPFIFTLLMYIVPSSPIALLGIISMFVGFNYFVDGFFMLFEKELNYTEYGLKELKHIDEFSNYVRTHSVFSKEENIVLYYDYLLYQYSLFNSKDLLIDKDLKPIYNIIKEYVFSN